MKSPFPGMDPYLEAHWGDVHTSLLVYARNQINEQLPPDLQARVEESLAVGEEGEEWNTHYPDVRVAEVLVPTNGSGTQPGGVGLAEPWAVVELDEPRTERHLEIIDTRSGQRVVTAIEVLSPGNKTGETGRRNYRKKQRRYLESGVNLVEIDLIRTGQYVLAAPESRLPVKNRSPYLCCIRRVAQPGICEVYRAPLREPLPNLPIPLRPTDTDIVLRLQPLLDDCYRDGRYSQINYSVDPSPPLGVDDAHWADALLRDKGLR
ncbi:MAG: DUF4058 family protein [Planctomycetota bacterium]|nr:DUF4058 family protein [Planctomycetota bacterium]